MASLPIAHCSLLLFLLHLRETTLNLGDGVADLLLASLVGRDFELALQLDAREAE